MTTSAMHYKTAMAIEKGCAASYGTEYERWPVEDLCAYAEHMMLALDAMSDEELAERFYDETDLRAARDSDRAYWIAIVAFKDQPSRKLR